MLAKNMKRMAVAVAATGLLFAGAGSASGLPITYTFDMPAFQGSGGFSGQTSTLDVLVDNGSTATANQSYLNTEILGLSVTVGAVNLSLNATDNFTLFVGSTPLITTDAFGIPTLDLNQSIDTRAVLALEFGGGAIFSSDNLLQLGTRDGSGPTEYFVRIGGLVGQNATGSQLVIAGQNTSSIAVPEPSTISMFGIGLAGLGFLGWRTRRRGRRSLGTSLVPA